MASNPADLLSSGSERLIATLQRALSLLHERSETTEKAVTALQSGQLQAVDSLVEQITSNFSALFTDASVVVSALQQGRYTSADVTGPVILAPQSGLALTLAVSGPVGFAPAPVVILGRKANTTDMAVARVASWSKETGTLVVNVIAAFGSAGPHADCYVEVGLLSTYAESLVLDLVEGMRSAVASDKGIVAADKAAVLEHKNTATSAAEIATAAAAAAVEAAEAAETWNPSNYYTKTEIDGQQTVTFFGAGALPSSDIGPIWHADYASIMTWQIFDANGAAYAGYASADIGMPSFDGRAAPRTGYLKRNGASLSKTTFAALWHWALHNGRTVALGSWAAGAFVFADNGDGTFRLPDTRGRFDRAWSDGSALDSGRAFGSAQADDNKDHGHDNGTLAGTAAAGGAHSHTVTTGGTATSSGSYVAEGGGVTGSVNTSTAATHTHSVTVTGSLAHSGGAEARPVNVALLGVIKF